jgi:hypothetical protein
LERTYQAARKPLAKPRRRDEAFLDRLARWHTARENLPLESAQTVVEAVAITARLCLIHYPYCGDNIYCGSGGSTMELGTAAAEKG